jgi:hypothetical protein
MIISVVGVLVSKSKNETCEQGIPDFMGLNAVICLAFASVFIHITLIRIGSDKEWFWLNFILMCLSIGEALILAWGTTMLLTGSMSLGVDQAFACSLTEDGPALDNDYICGDGTYPLDIRSISSFSECPGWGDEDEGNINISCEIAYICQVSAPHTWGWGLTVVITNLISAIWSNYLIYCTFMTFLVRSVMGLARQR